MNKNPHILLLMTVSVLMLSGCDFVRKSLGRPTSVDIEEKRVEIVRREREKEEAIRRNEELRLLAEASRADSLAALDSIASKRIQVHTVSELGALREDAAMETSYAVVIGMFSREANALKLQELVRDAGYEVGLLGFARGLTAVAVGASDLVQDVYKTWEHLREEDFAPSDLWIIKNE